MVVCKFNRCGFFQDGFCTNPTILINENGMCSHLYKIKNGGIIETTTGAFDKIDEIFKSKIEIETIENFNKENKNE